MLAFLFWNLANKLLQTRVASLARLHDVNIILLAECTIPEADILGTLGAFHVVQPTFRAAGRIQLLSSLPAKSFGEVLSNPLRNLLIWKLSIGTHPEILIAAAHLPSKLHKERDDQTGMGQEVARNVVTLESERRHDRTILVGDLNMNPFDPGIANGYALHAVMTQEIARRGERTMDGRPRPFFYNPMWGFFGDRTSGPPGPYFLNKNYFWNIYDQVLVRPSLLDVLGDVRILDRDEHGMFVDERGHPDSDSCSDHLPIYFELKV